MRKLKKITEYPEFRWDKFYEYSFKICFWLTVVPYMFAILIYAFEPSFSFGEFTKGYFCYVGLISWLSPIISITIELCNRSDAKEEYYVEVPEDRRR